MKTKILTVLCVLIIGLGSVNTTRADDSDPLDIVADMAIVRPACFVVTLFGTAVFVVALPVAAISKSVKNTANVLVGRPARATFTRPLGDFSTLRE